MKKIQQSVQMPSSEIFTIPGSTVSAEMINMESLPTSSMKTIIWAILLCLDTKERSM